jgi:Protein of unknown function (DUF2523)
MEGLAAWLGAKIDAVLAWARELVVSGFEALLGLLKDAVIWVIDGFGGVTTALLGGISVPASVQSGLGGLFAGLPPSILWGAGELGIPQCLAIIGAAYVVRLVRIVVTLFQWS